MAPALQLTGGNLEGVLRESSRTGSGSRRLTRTRHGLVVCQIALALVLLIGAGLLLRSFDRLRSQSLGIDTTDVITFQVNLPLARYGEPDTRARFHRDLEARLAKLPGVRAAGAVSRLPVTGTYHRWGTVRDDLPSAPRLAAEQRTIEGAYFDALRIPVLRGRTFAAGDDGSAPRRAVISQELARQMFGADDPIGRTIRVLGSRLEVIGVVGDAAISARGTVRPMVYQSHSQFAANRNWALTQLVALDRATPAGVDAVRREVLAMDPALVLYQPRMMSQVAGHGIAQEQFVLWLVSAFALLALVLATVGVYGVMSYSVTRRSREMGIRMALGATAGTVSLLILRDGIRLAVAGVAAGLAGAFAATRALQSLLFGVSATEPAVFGLAAAALAAVAVAASGIPARAATRVDPIHAVRADQ
jgi:putative ABC transport system permease protein